MIKINILEGQITSTNESKTRLKHERPLGLKDKNPQKKRGLDESIISNKIQLLEKVPPEEPTSKENKL